MKLTAKQQCFIEEYLVDLNATQAAIRAGYSKKTAYIIGDENLKKPKIAAAIQAAMSKRSERTEITQDQVVRELARIGFSDLRKVMTPGGALLSPHDWDDDTAASIAAIEVVTVHRGDEDENGNKVPERIHKIKTWDKNSALEKLAKHLGMLNTKVDITHTIKEKDDAELIHDLRRAAEQTGFGLDALEGMKPGSTTIN